MSTRSFHITLAAAPDEPSLHRTVDEQALGAVLEALHRGELPAGADLSVREVARLRRSAPEAALAA